MTFAVWSPLIELETSQALNFIAEPRKTVSMNKEPLFHLVSRMLTTDINDCSPARDVPFQNHASGCQLKAG